MEHTPQDEQHEPLTYAQIKEYINTLSEDQLQQKAYIWVADNENATEIHAFDALGEDMYYFIDHEYSCSKSDFDKDIILDEIDEPLYQTIEEAIENEDYIITPANRVYFHAFDF